MVSDSCVFSTSRLVIFRSSQQRANRCPLAGKAGLRRRCDVSYIHVVPRIFSAWDSDVAGASTDASGWPEPQRRDKLGFEWNDRKLVMGLCCWRSPDSGVVCVSRTLRTPRKMCKSGIQTVGKLTLEARRDTDQRASG